MKRMNNRAIMIQKRFFDALDTGIQLGRYGGIKTFCDEHGLNRTKYSRIRTGIQDPSNARYYTTIDIDALAAICSDLGVNPEWLLLGRGKMLKPSHE